MELLCPDCGEWCKTGVHSQIGLWADGHFRSLSNHRMSRKCEATAKKKRQAGTMPSAAPLPRSSISESDRYASCQFISVPFHDTFQHQTCAGISVVWPEDLRPFAMLFPWERYHAGPDSLPFTVDISNCTTPRARSKRCLARSAVQGLPCEECADVPMHIARIAEVARDPKSHTNYKFLGLAHMQDIARTYANQLNDLKLQV
ncbi:hypothetical protein P692DRAFT_20723497, partial [Suillus brevipes Sb2]